MILDAGTTVARLAAAIPAGRRAHRRHPRPAGRRPPRRPPRHRAPPRRRPRTAPDARRRRRLGAARLRRDQRRRPVPRGQRLLPRRRSDHPRPRRGRRQARDHRGRPPGRTARRLQQVRQEHFARFGDLADVDLLITDSGLSAEDARAIEEQGHGGGARMIRHRHPQPQPGPHVRAPVAGPRRRPAGHRRPCRPRRQGRQRLPRASPPPATARSPSCRWAVRRARCSAGLLARPGIEVDRCPGGRLDPLNISLAEADGTLTKINATGPRDHGKRGRGAAGDGRRTVAWAPTGSPAAAACRAGYRPAGTPSWSPAPTGRVPGSPWTPPAPALAAALPRAPRRGQAERRGARGGRRPPPGHRRRRGEGGGGAARRGRPRRTGQPRGGRAAPGRRVRHVLRQRPRSTPSAATSARATPRSPGSSSPAAPARTPWPRRSHTARPPCSCPAARCRPRPICDPSAVAVTADVPLDRALTEPAP